MIIRNLLWRSNCPTATHMHTLMRRFIRSASRVRRILQLCSATGGLRLNILQAYHPLWMFNVVCMTNRLSKWILLFSARTATPPAVSEYATRQKQLSVHVCVCVCVYAADNSLKFARAILRSRRNVKSSQPGERNRGISRVNYSRLDDGVAVAVCVRVCLLRRVIVRFRTYAAGTIHINNFLTCVRVFVLGLLGRERRWGSGH